MSKWHGFDQRKICPKCGEYQTRVTSKQPQSFSSHRVLFLLMRYIAVAILPMIALLLLYLRALNVYLLGLFFMGFVGLVIFFAYRSIYSGEKEKIVQQSRENNWIGYSLYCRNCGYTWEMTSEEWETAGHQELEELRNSPSFLPSRRSDLIGPFEKIEWKPPDPMKGISIVINLVILGLLAASSAYGVLWSLTHSKSPSAAVISLAAFVLAIVVSIGLMRVFRFRITKPKIISLILIFLIGMIGFAVQFLLK